MLFPHFVPSKTVLSAGEFIESYLTDLIQLIKIRKCVNKLKYDLLHSK